MFDSAKYQGRLESAMPHRSAIRLYQACGLNTRGIPGYCEISNIREWVGNQRLIRRIDTASGAKGTMGKISTLIVIGLYIAVSPLFGSRPLDSLARHTLVRELAARQATPVAQAATAGFPPLLALVGTPR